MSIPIEREKAEGLLKQNWVQDRLRQTHRRLEKLSEAYYRLPLTDDNTCVFLADDKRCLIEVHEGRERKPEECKRFPFAAVKTMEGQLAYDASASCKHVAEVLISGFRPIVPRPESDLGLLPQDFPERIPVGIGRRTFDLPTFWRYQEQLTEIFRGASSAHEALGVVQDYLRDQNTKTHLKVETEPFYEEFPSPLGGEGARRADEGLPYLAWALALYLLRKPYGSWSWFQMLLQRQVVDTRIFGETTVSTSQPLNTADETLLKGFLHNILRRYVLISHGHSLAQMLGLACAGYVLVQWYAAALGETSLAIRIVERYYTGHHPYFLERFRSTRLGWWCRKALLG